MAMPRENETRALTAEEINAAKAAAKAAAEEKVRQAEAALAEAEALTAGPTEGNKVDETATSPAPAEEPTGGNEVDETTTSPAPAEEPTKAVSTDTKPTVLAKTGAAVKQLIDEMADMGLEGLQFDWTSLPIVVLDKGWFKVDGEKLGDSLRVKVQSSRVQWLYSAETGDRESSDDAELAYSDDNVTTTKEGITVADVLADWKARGLTVRKTQYLMMTCTMYDGSMEGEIVVLQVPPRSAPKFTGYAIKLKQRGKTPLDVITEITLGEEVGKGVKAFQPMVFDEYHPVL